jgi:hypothetical protein
MKGHPDEILNASFSVTFSQIVLEVKNSNPFIMTAGNKHSQRITDTHV